MYKLPESELTFSPKLTLEERLDKLQFDDHELQLYQCYDCKEQHDCVYVYDDYNLCGCLKHDDIKQYTCYTCNRRKVCHYAFDNYNINGDCLMDK